MKLILDTQVFVWLIDKDKRLGAKALHTIRDTSNDVYISYFSFFEMTIKASIGKLTFDSSVMDDLPKMGIELVMPDQSALSAYTVFNPNNKDPFDNMLIAVARSQKYTLVTSDPKILATKAPGLKVLNATK